MGYLSHFDVLLALAILALALLVAGYFIWNSSISILKTRIKKSPTTRSGVDAAQKLLSLPGPKAFETSRRLMLAYGDNLEAANLLVSSLQSAPNDQWTNVLIELSLKRKNSDIQHVALKALAQVPQTEITLNVFKLLFGDPDPTIATISAWALAKTGHRDAVAYLMESGAPDSEIETITQSISSPDYEHADRFHDRMIDQVRSYKLSDVDALKVGTLLLERVDKLPIGVVNALFQLRNRGAYLALAQSLEEGILLDTGTLRTLAQMGYSQVAGRLTDDLLRFGWQSESHRNRGEEVWSAKSTLEQFLRDFGVQISLSHLRKMSEIQDFFYWADPPIRIDLSQLREEASALIDRHIEFWNVPSQEIASNAYTDSCALDLAS